MNGEQTGRQRLLGQLAMSGKGLYKIATIMGGNHGLRRGYVVAVALRRTKTATVIREDTRFVRKKCPKTPRALFIATQE